MRKYHRVAGAVLAAQLVAWIATGLLFNVKYRYDEAFEPLAAKAAPAQPDAPWVSPAQALAAAAPGSPGPSRVELLHDNRGDLYLFEIGPGPNVVLADAHTGARVEPLDAAGAYAALESALAGSAAAPRYGAVTASTKVDAPSARLGRSTDAWQLALATGQTVTVNPYTAEIAHTAPLNTWIDWTYRVHYMQYTPWKAANIAIVTVFCALLLSLVVSGLNMLGVFRARRRRYGYGARKLKF